MYQKEQLITQFNIILDTIKSMDTNLTNSEVKFSYVEQNDIKIKKINDESEDKNQQNIKNSERLFNEGLVFSIHLFCFRVVKNLNKFQETIECYEKAIFINPKNENGWKNKGNALYNLNKYQEAIECYDKVISINSKHDNTWSIKVNYIKIPVLHYTILRNMWKLFHVIMQHFLLKLILQDYNQKVYKSFLQIQLIHQSG